MENENLEEIIEEVIEDVPGEVVNESVEEVREERTNDSSDNSIDVSSMADIGSDLSSNQSLEELLREYFSGSREVSIVSSEELSNEGAIEGASDIDYTELLNEILSVSEDSASYQSSIIAYMEDYEENNQFTSDIDSISLTNILLLFVFIGLLALGAINFSRRIL